MSVSIGTENKYHGYPFVSNGNNESRTNVVQLPSFKLTAKQEAEGNVEVTVEDQFGQIIKPDIKSNNGVYNSTFLPKSPGDYLVSIRVDDEDIEGSPFYVKVFDPSLIKVIALRAGIISTLNTFSVSTAGIGEGPLAITIVNLTNNQILPAKIIQDSTNNKLFHIQWMPSQPGFVKIHINFAGVEALGSPYRVEVIDPSLTSIVGPGLGGMVMVNSKVVFNVKTPSNMVVLDQLKVVIMDPTGNRVKSGVLDGGNGSAAIEFVPFIVGPYKLEVFYFGKPIRNSPFLVKAYDSSRVRILNWKSTGQVDQAVEFDVDISVAGPGQFDIQVSGGEAPYKIKERELGKYKVTYTPKHPGALEFSFSFNMKKIQGGPWICTIQSPPTASVTGNGVRTFPALPTNSPTTFQVKLTGPINGDLDIHVIDPNGQSVQADLMSYQNLMYTYQYIPRSVGNYNIEVRMEGNLVPGSPFHSKAYSPGSVILGDVQTGFVGRTVEFNVDTSQSGEGSLEVLVERGSVACTVHPEDSRGSHTVSFVPKEARLHSISVMFNGQVVRGSPLSVNILDPSKVALVGKGDDCKVPVNKPCSLRLNITGAGNGLYTALARAPSGAEISVGLRENNQRTLEIEYTPREVGVHAIEVELEGCSLPINPLQVSAYDISKIRVGEIMDGVVNQQAKILVESGDPGEGDLTFSVYGPGGNLLHNSIEQNSPSTYSILFTPLQKGVHQFVASFNNENIIGSPFHFNVYDIANVTASGNALKTFPCGKMCNFFISSQDPLRALSCTVKIIDPNLQNVGARMYDISDGSVKAEFLGTTPGDYRIDVKCHGQTINGSPFISKCWDINKVSVTPIHHAVVGVQSSFNISVKEAGEGTLEIGITNPSGQQIANAVNPLAPGQFVVSFSPSVQGSHQANVTFNDESVLGSPFAIEVNDPRKALARGNGLELVKCNKPANFEISCPGVALNDLSVNITGPKNSNVRFRLAEQTMGQFRVDYTPIITGDHLIEIDVFGKAIPGSPFIAKCWDNQKVSCTKIASAKVGQQTSFNLDVSLAGEGDIEIVIHGPSGSNISNTVTPLGPGMFMVAFVPLESGMHKASITFNQDHVIGSPFTFNVIDLARASARGEGLGLVKVQTTATFLITAPGASQRDIEVYINAPNGKELSFRMSENANDSFKVDYTPTIPGDHRIEVTYFGQSLPGSPFFTRAWDPCKVFVTNIRNSKIAYNNTFNLDVNDAGEGTLEIGVTNPSGQNIHNNVTPCGPGKFEVTSVPEEHGKFKVTVTFNKESVPGSPYFFLVTDVTKVAVRGDGVGCVKCGVTTSLVIFAPVAQQKDVEVVVNDPENNELVTRIMETSMNNFKVEYTPKVIGTHHVRINYFGQSVPSSPFQVEVWDPSRAQLNIRTTFKVNEKVTLRVDHSKAGKGTMEAEVTHCNGRLLNCTLNQLHSGCCEVAFTPVEAGQHRVAVLMNKEHIAGSPCSFLAIDPTRSGVRGQGLCVVPCNKTTSFTFRAPAANPNDIYVKITGPDYRDVPYRTVENMDMFDVEYTPIKPGEYVIEVTYFGEQVPGCPFSCRAFDPSMVQLAPVKCAFVAKEAHFNVNTANAGQGDLEVVITAGGQPLKAYVKSLSNGVNNVSFTPVECCIHEVCVKFNEVNVPGSPFRVQIINGALATASGRGLEEVKVGSVGAFEVRTNNPPLPSSAACLEVNITNERCQVVPCKIVPSGSTFYNVEYTPRESGSHKVEIKFAGQHIQGCPFMVHVTDPSMVMLQYSRQGVVGKKYTFEVDTMRCGGGGGELVVEVSGQATSPKTHVTSSKGIYRVSFVASEACSHSIEVTYFGEVIPECPFLVNFIDTETMWVEWEQLDLLYVHRPVTFELQMGKHNAGTLAHHSRTEETTVNCRIRDPEKREVRSRIGKTSRAYQVTFTPDEIGPYRIELTFGKKIIDGSPYTCQVFCPNSVVIREATTQNCVGKESSFVVDLSEAGVGEVGVEVFCGNIEVPCQAVPLQDKLTRFVFVPISGQLHRAIVNLNSEIVAGSPVLFNVMDPSSSIKLVAEQRDVMSGEMLCASLISSTMPLKVELVTIDARGPGSEVLIATKKAALDGRILIAFSGQCAGRYTLAVAYGGKAVAGVPLFFDVSDASMVLAQVPSEGVVGHTTAFEVSMTEAGENELNVRIFDCESNMVPSSVQRQANCYRVSYLPVLGGLHKIHITYGGVEISGSPFHQHVTDGFAPGASGQGLMLAIEGERTSFIVHNEGRPGDVEIRILGPKYPVSAKVDNLGHDGPSMVSYTPREPGLHTISAIWDQKHVKGSPFQVMVECSKEVDVIGGNASMDRYPQPETEVRLWVPECPPPPQASGEGLHLAIVCRDAQFIVVTQNDEACVTATIIGVDSEIPVHVAKLCDQHGKFKCTYAAKTTGMYLVSVCCNGQQVAGSPFKLRVVDCCIVANGYDLRKAKLNRETEFLIECLPGVTPPVIRMWNDKKEVPVNIRQGTCPGTYKCFYTPKEKGDYKLTIEHDNCSVKGSPFHVVVECEDNSFLTGPGLHHTTCHQPSHFFVDDASCTPIVQMTGPNGQMDAVFVQVDSMTGGKYRCSYQVTEPGEYKIRVTGHCGEMSGSPFQVRAVPGKTTLPIVMGPGLYSASCCCPTEFIIDASASNLADSTPWVRITGENCELDYRMEKISECQYRVVYQPDYAGDLFINITYGDYTLNGSPYKVHVMANDKCNNVTQCNSHCCNTNCNANDYNTNCHANDYNTNCTANVYNTNCNENVYNTNVNETCCKTDCNETCRNANSVVAFGRGLVEGEVLCPCQFIIDSTQTSAGRPGVKVTCGAMKVPCEIVQVVPKVFKCTYVPTHASDHLVHIKHAGVLQPGAPYRVNIHAQHQEKTMVVTGPGINLAILNQRAEFLLDGFIDGEFSVEMSCLYGHVPIEVFKVGEDTFVCVYIPLYMGDHTLCIRNCGEHISGSPFAVQVLKEVHIQPLPPSCTGRCGCNCNDDEYQYHFETHHPPMPFHQFSHQNHCCSAPALTHQPPICDPSSFVALGPGLTSALVGNPSEFFIDGPLCEMPDIRMVGTEGNINVHCDRLNDRVFKSSYVPRIPGVYLLSIDCCGKSIPGSPFKVTVSNVSHPPSCCAAVAVGEGLITGSKNKKAEFAIEGIAGCVPVVECLGPSGPLTVSSFPDGHDRFKCYFYPKDSGEYLIYIAVEGTQVCGSPFRVNVAEQVQCNPAEVVVIGEGVHTTKVGFLTEFFVNTSNAEGDIDVRLLSPVGHVVPVQKEVLSRTVLKCSYATSVAGSHQLCITCCGKDIPGSPFTLYSLPLQLPVVQGPGLVGCFEAEVAEFMVEGCTEPPVIMMMGPEGEIPVFVREDSQGCYNCTYTPQIPGPYQLDVCHGDMQLPGFPMQIDGCGHNTLHHHRPVVPPVVPIIHNVQASDASILLSPPFAVGTGLAMGIVHTPSEFIIENAADDPEIQLVSCESDVFVRCFKVSDFKYRCVYIPTLPGVYMLYVSINGVQINGSPFKVIIQHSHDGHFNDSHDTHDFLHPSNIHELTASPGQGDSISVKKSSIFSPAFSSGPGIVSAQLAKEAEFFVDGAENEPIAKLYGMEHDVEVRFAKVGGKRYKGTYKVTKPGVYMLTILCDGYLVPGSPFKIQVKGLLRAGEAEIYRMGGFPGLPINSSPGINQPLKNQLLNMPQKVIVGGTGLSTAVVAQQTEFMADVSNAGEGHMTAKLVGIATSVSVLCHPVGEGKYQCTYTPRQQGAYLLNVTWSDKPIPGSPFKVNVTSSVDPSKVRLLGDYVNAAGSIGRPSTVMVDASAAGKDVLQASCKAPSRFVPCEVTEAADGKFNVSFTPEEAGLHLLNLNYANAIVPGCPVSVKVAHQVDASKVMVSGEGINGGILATFQSDFSVDTRGAGPGQLTCRMRGKKSTFKIEMKRDPVQNRLIHCRFNPTEVGVYVLETKWSGTQVPGSPHHINLFDTHQQLQHFLSGGGGNPRASFESLTSPTSAFYE